MKKIFTIVVIFAVTTVLILFVATWLVKQPMSWYQPPRSTDFEVAKLAGTAEQRLSEEFHKIRPQEDVWKLRIQDKASNAWLATRLEGWMTHDHSIELPSEFTNPFMRTTPSGIWIAGMVNLGDEVFQPIAIQIDIQIEQQGTIQFTPKAVRLGRIPLPVSMIESGLQDFGDDMTQISSMIPLLDDRSVEIKSILLEEGSIVLTCQTRLP